MSCGICWNRRVILCVQTKKIVIKLRGKHQKERLIAFFVCAVKLVMPSSLVHTPSYDSVTFLTIHATKPF